jgi:hypothetical protein
MTSSDPAEIDDDLTGSYNAIDYRLRPAKHAERAMLVEATARLRFADLQMYRYVGFGSIYFTDFKLFHRVLGITDFHNIEGREVDKTRFNWNRPFSSIKMHFGMSGKVLPGLSWKKRSIVWLDYDGQLNGSKLKDIDFLIRNARSGSFLLFSINAEKPSPPGLSREEREKDLPAALRLLVGAERVKSTIKDSDLRGKFAGRAYYQIISAAIESSLAVYNRLIEDPGDERVWRQVIHIAYRDGARMLTVGGVLYDRRDEAAFVAGQFERLSFFHPGEEAFDIEVPKLTLKEMAFLEKSALVKPERATVPAFLKRNDRSDFLKLFRYLPSYVSADL